MKEIEFWFSIGSTYSYLTVMRLEAFARREGVQVIWQPFNVREIMVAQKNIPFAGKPVKLAYMWRDLERRAAKYGLSPRLPAPYPLENLPFANQLATLGKHEGWCVPYVVETYRVWFEEGHPAGSEPNMTTSLKRIGQDPSRAIELAETSAIRQALAAATSEASAAGVFGSPTFVVGNEVFWGDDRLEDAVEWARKGRLDPPDG